MKIGIQCSSLGERCGIYTYSMRLQKYLEKHGVETVMFAGRCRDKVDMISIQYEPGLMPPQALKKFIDDYKQPLILTVHHTGYLPQMYDQVDGMIFHNQNQIPPGDNQPWSHVVIPHPALVFDKKKKEDMRKKYGIPLDKKVIGTAGFIAGTGKHIPEVTSNILEKLKKDEFLYNITSFWKGGDFGYSDMVNTSVRKLGKEKNFKMDTEFIPAEILNEKMQCCDLLFTWNESLAPGGTSGIAMDMLGAWRKVIVKDAPHYKTAADVPEVLVGRQNHPDFVDDLLKALRTEDLTKIADPKPYDWDVLIDDMIEYYETWL